MSTYARRFAASLGKANTGQAASITLAIKDASGVAIAGATFGTIVETTTGTGNYAVTCTNFDPGWSGTLEWIRAGTAGAIDDFTPQPEYFQALSINSAGQVATQGGGGGGTTGDTGTVASASSSQTFVLSGAGLHATRSGWYNGQVLSWTSPAQNTGAERVVGSHTYDPNTGLHTFVMQAPFPLTPAVGDSATIA